MGLAVQSTMTYDVLRCVANGMRNEWEDTARLDPTTHRTMSERSISELRPAPLHTHAHWLGLI